MNNDQKKEIIEANVLSDEEMEDVGGGYNGAVITAEDAVYRGDSPIMSNALLQDDDEPAFIKTPFNDAANSGGLLKKHFRFRRRLTIKKNRNPGDFFSGGGGGGMTQG